MCQGYKRSLAAEQAIEHILKDKKDVAAILSNLLNDSQTSNSSKAKGMDVNTLIPREQDTLSKDDKHTRLWKCNFDAFLDNPGITSFPAFDESKAFHGKTLCV
jgi:hypothetical protein